MTLTPEQINANQGKGKLARQAEVSSVNEDARTVELAFSSESPVLRWFGEEVLDHTAGAMRTERLESGAALLVNHDWDDQVGVVESVSIGADRRGRAVVRFGRGARANEIWQDVVDGIRKHVSVGYSVHGIEVEERKGMPDLVRVTDWEPYEISLVSVPADPTVGVGRSMPENSPEDDRARHADNHLKPEEDNESMSTQNPAAPQTAESVDVAAERRAASDAERQRVRSIMEMGEQYGAEDLAREAVKGDTSVADFQRKLLDHLDQERGKPLSDAADADIGMSDTEVRQFSFLRALRALANPTDRKAQEAAAFEYEASRAAAERAGKEPEGILVPSDVLRRALNTDTSGSSAGDTGGYSIATDLLSQSFVEMLRNRTVLMQLGTTMGGLVGNIAIPRQSDGASGYWIGEDEDAPEDNLELDQIGMTPKTVAALSEVTRKLLLQSSLDVEALIRADLAKALALTIDYAGFYGTGSSNQPLGIVNASGINSVDFSVAEKPTYAELVQMESEIAADNADVNSMSYVLNSRMRGYLKTTEKFSGTNGSPIWEPGNTVNGYNSQVTNQIANGDVIFGNFADLLIGMWGGLDLTVDPYTHSAKGRLRIVAMQDVDFVLRRVESFCLGRNTP